MGRSPDVPPAGMSVPLRLTPCAGHHRDPLAGSLTTAAGHSEDVRHDGLRQGRDADCRRRRDRTGRSGGAHRRGHRRCRRSRRGGGCTRRHPPELPHAVGGGRRPSRRIARPRPTDPAGRCPRAAALPSGPIRGVHLPAVFRPPEGAFGQGPAPVHPRRLRLAGGAGRDGAGCRYRHRPVRPAPGRQNRGGRLQHLRRLPGQGSRLCAPGAPGSGGPGARGHEVRRRRSAAEPQDDEGLRRRRVRGEPSLRRRRHRRGVHDRTDGPIGRGQPGPGASCRGREHGGRAAPRGDRDRRREPAARCHGQHRARQPPRRGLHRPRPHREH